jgi:hypothetical protein
LRKDREVRLKDPWWTQICVQRLFSRCGAVASLVEDPWYWIYVAMIIYIIINIAIITYIFMKIREVKNERYDKYLFMKKIYNWWSYDVHINNIYG